MKKKIVLATGGTGGHVFPAQALAEQLGRLDSPPKMLFMGGKLGSNPFFDKSFYPFYEVPCGQLPLRHPLKALKGLWAMLQGVKVSFLNLKKFRPDLVVGFGSYHSFPVLLAARLLSIPIVLHEGNVVPGKVNRLFSKMARLTAITFPETSLYLRGETVETKMPLREGYCSALISKEKARRHFGLDTGKKTLLVFGGSQGAHGLNKLVVSSLEKLVRRLEGLQVLHFSGSQEATSQLCMDYNTLGLASCVRHFETRMDLAWQAADLAITRAGAMSLLEQIEMEVPGILIPYPHAASDHQRKNAEFMVRRVGGAIKFEEKVAPQALADAIFGLLTCEEDGVKKMQSRMRRYKQGLLQQELHTIVMDIIGWSEDTGDKKWST